jgi:hypothetical protein
MIIDIAKEKPEYAKILEVCEKPAQQIIVGLIAAQFNISRKDAQASVDAFLKPAPHG